MVSLIKSIPAHTDKAWSVSAHPTLPLLATASTDKTSHIYNLSSRKNFPLLGKLEDTHKRSVRSVAFKPPLGGAASPVTEFLDLPALSSGSFDSTISIWGIDEPEEMMDQDDDDDIDQTTKTRRQNELLVSENNEWNLMAIIEGHENEVKAVSWNPHGNLLASCSRDKTIWIWETDPETLEEFECIAVLSDHQHDIKHIVWHPTQNLLASSSYDDTIRLYKQDDDDDDEWTCVGVLNGHEGTVWCSSFDHSEKLRLVSCSDDLSVRIWSSGDDITSTTSSALPSSIRHSSEMVWELETVLPSVHTYPIYSVAWLKSGKIASAGSDGKLVIYTNSNGQWEIESVQESAHGVYEINCVIFCELDDGQEVVVTAGDDGKINIWSLR